MSETNLSEAAAALGRKGGKVSSAKKTAACRMNAKKPRNRKRKDDPVGGITSVAKRIATP